MTIDTDAVTIDLKPGVCPDWASFGCDWALTQVLAELTGIKATLPITIVSWWALLGNCPLVLAGGPAAYLITWPGCLMLTVLMVTEVVLDLFPGIASAVDVVMLFVKPIFAFILIAALDNPENSDTTMLYFIMRIWGPLSTMVVAIADATIKVANDGGSAGACAPVRSVLETVSTFVATILSALYIAMAFLLAVGIAGLATFVICWLRRKRKERRERKKARRAESSNSWGWARTTRGVELDSDDDTSDDSDGDSGFGSESDRAGSGAEGAGVSASFFDVIRKAQPLPAGATLEDVRRLPVGEAFLVPGGSLGGRLGGGRGVSREVPTTSSSGQDLVQVTPEGLLVTPLTEEQVGNIETSLFLQG